MLKGSLAFLTIIVIIVACSKGKLETNPFIELKNINATELYDTVQDNSFVIDLNFKDKEGDLGNGVLTYIRYRQNTIGSPINDQTDTIRYAIPDFPKATTGEFKLLIPVGFLNEDPNRNDTVIFRMFATDVAGHRSDTISTPT